MRSWIFFILLLLPLLGCQKASPPKMASYGLAMIVSVSSDGRHVLSSHNDKRLILWDVTTGRTTVISERVNIYSAFFVPGRDVFIWQDLQNIVHIQKMGGEEIRSFQHFPTYGHRLSQDLKKYVSCDESWNLYIGHGEDLRPIKKDGNSPSFAGIGKLLNLTLSRNGEFLLSAGDGFDIPDKRSIFEYSPMKANQRYSNYAGVVLWSLSNHSPISKFPGHEAKSTAILSPDGKYVISGSENGVGRVWEANTGKEKHQLASIFHGVLNKNGSDDYEKWTYDNTGLIPAPEDLNSNSAVLAFRFIDPEHYLCFLTYSSYAVLYHIDNPLPLKYLPLGRKPFPAVDDYSRNAALDTAPEAGILVMGEQDGGGIIVYKYDSTKQELEKIRVAD